MVERCYIVLLQGRFVYLLEGGTNVRRGGPIHGGGGGGGAMVFFGVGEIMEKGQDIC